LAFAHGSDFAIHDSEIPALIKRIIQIESRGDDKALNTTEYSVGRMQITRVGREEVNQWAGTNFTYWDMFDGEKNQWCGSYLLTNVLIKYRCRGNVIQAVGAYNVGIVSVYKGIYPDDYLAAAVGPLWGIYKARFITVSRWRDKSGAWIVELRDIYGRPPKLGI